jgi:hypothetical protein
MRNDDGRVKSTAEKLISAPEKGSQRQHCLVAAGDSSPVPQPSDQTVIPLAGKSTWCVFSKIA